MHEASTTSAARRRPRRLRILSAVAILLLILVAYEGWRVASASRQLDTVVARYLADDPANLRWAELSEWQQRALIRVEDPAFFEHSGIDFTSAGAGLTSIPQALTKRLFFDPFRPGFRKIEQSLIARFVVSPGLSKEDQLTAFINAAYLGHRDGRDIIGFQNAARSYFGRDVADLDEDQYLRLVGALLAPTALQPRPEGNPASDERLRRIKRYLDGTCAPEGVMDVRLEGC